MSIGPLKLRPQHVGRYRDLAKLLVKYGRSDVVRLAGLDDVLGEDVAVGDDAAAEAAELACDLERMGPAFVKLGQLLSTRADLLPPPYLEALSRLQDDVDPLAFDVVEQVVTDELGVRMSKVFMTFDETPIASASIGQVHRATLRGGRDVVVKVQRPGIRRQIAADLEVLEEIAGFLDDHTEQGRKFAVADLLDRFHRSLVDELDYRKEAANLVRLARIVADRPRVLVPRPYDDFTTGRMLTMEWVDGVKVTELSPLARLDLDAPALAHELFAAYLDQILVHGFFHADPHPGNVLVTRDGRLALIDVGMVGRATPAVRGRLIRLLLAVADEQVDEVARIAERMSTPLPSYDESRFRQHVADLVDRSVRQRIDELDAGRIVLELTRICGDSGLRPPTELSLIGKALLNLDQAARTLDPDVRPVDAVREHAGALLRAQATPSLSGLASAMLDARDFAEQFPGRVNRVMDALSDGSFELRIKAFDEAVLMHGVHKAANRIVMGLVLAALVIGAAMLTRVPSATKIFGYPAVAFVFFVAAALGGFALLVSILVADRRVKRRRGRRR